MMKKTILLVLILLCGDSNAEANGKQVWAGDLLVGSFDAEVRKDRLRIAQGLFKTLSALKEYLPQLTADQKEWLEVERASLNSIKGAASVHKYRAFSSSSEYRLAVFHVGLDNILEPLICVLDENVSLKKELLCWALINYALTDSGTFHDSIYWLNARNVVSFPSSVKDQFLISDFKDDFWNLYHSLGRSIQGTIVITLTMLTDGTCTQK